MKSADGKVVLDSLVKDKHFYGFPFEIVEVASDVPYSPGAYRFLEGDWNDQGYLYTRDANPAQNLFFKLWLRNKACESSKSVRPTMEGLPRRGPRRRGTRELEAQSPGDPRP